jgi:hypothetical protein
MTIKDIARLAGVSPATVSRVINNVRGVGGKNRQKVLAVIKEYSFRPNHYAHHLALRCKEESRLPLELFIADLEKQGMPPHCGLCSQYLLCIKENPALICPWIKKYKHWQGHPLEAAKIFPVK